MYTASNALKYQNLTELQNHKQYDEPSVCK